MWKDCRYFKKVEKMVTGLTHFPLLFKIMKDCHCSRPSHQNLRPLVDVEGIALSPNPTLLMGYNTKNWTPLLINNFWMMELFKIEKKKSKKQQLFNILKYLVVFKVFIHGWEILQNILGHFFTCHTK